VEAYGSATVEAYDSATVEAYDSATVEAYDSATVEAYDSATVEACEGKSTVCLWSKAKAAKPVGPWAVVIDRTGDKIKIVKGK